MKPWVRPVAKHALWLGLSLLLCAVSFIGAWLMELALTG